MAILADQNTRVIIQGITGRDGSFHARAMREYGTRVVAGVTPGKGGQEVDGIPVYDSVREALEAHPADASVIFVPAPFAADAMAEAADAGISLIVTITEGIPLHDMMWVYRYIRARGATLIGPNSPGLISPGKTKLGILPGHVFTPGPVGVVSRSGTLTYEIASHLTKAGLGQSTVVGIGGDQIIGSRFVDVLRLFKEDPETQAVVIIGEIGGQDEQEAAEYIREELGKPAVAFIAGRTAPKEKRMGHAGAIIAGSEGTAEEKIRAFEAAGVPVAALPEEVPLLLKEKLKAL